MNDNASTDALLRDAFTTRLQAAPQTSTALHARTIDAIAPRAAGRTMWLRAAARWPALAAPARWAVAAAIVIVGGTLSIGTLRLAHHADPENARPFNVSYDQRSQARTSIPIVAMKMKANTATATPVAAAAPMAPAQTAPQLARVGEMAIVVRDVASALKSIREMTAREAGFVSALQDNTPDNPAEPRNAWLSVTVPSARLDAVMDTVAATGAVTSRSTKGEDVSSSIVDTSAHLNNLQHEERDLLKIMDRGGKTSDVLDVQTHLSDVRDQIETLDAQTKLLHDRVATATLDITITQDRLQHAAILPSGGTRVDAIWQVAHATPRSR